MSSKITTIRQGELEIYEPERHRLTIAGLDFGIEEAKRIKDWPTLEEAIDLKIEEQRKFVAWWGATVRNDGRPRKEKNGPGTRTVLSATDAEDQTGMTKQRVSDLGKRLMNPDKYRVFLLGAEYRAAMLEAVDNVRGTQGTGENEWFTPVEYIELARAVLGEIDLDPATHEQAQAIVQARQFFTKADNGLEQEWRGRVWLNPPYAQPLIAHFISKMCAEIEAGHVTAAIILTHNYTDTAWFHELAGAASAMCFMRGRVKFYEADGSIAAPTQGQTFTYFGNDVDLFADVFTKIGFVASSIVPRGENHDD